MKYLSTRGGDERLTFEETVLSGLAPNGGLYIPSTIPKLPQNWQSDWSSLSFTQLALEIYSLFIPTNEINRDELQELINKSYSSFSHPQIAPLKKLNSNLHVLELWHGPTFAFKDVALQFLGNLFEFFLVRKNSTEDHQNLRHRLTVVGATSGDTGSAAIYGLRGKKDVSIFILHPCRRVSPIQEAQMTTVMDENVFNLAVEGTFDDCQDIVKSLFNDFEFNSKYQLAAINSINWARILAQIVYYFSSYFHLSSTIFKPDQNIQFVVPTGNFGDILAGFYAQALGLPIGQRGKSPGLVIATNSNDILTRFWESGRYEKSGSSSVGRSSTKVNLQTEPVGGSSDGQQPNADLKNNLVKATLSPAMDIMVSSNFERLLFYLAFDTLTRPNESETQRTQKSQNQVNQWMSELKSAGRFQVEDSTLSLARDWFGADRVVDQETCQTIKKYFDGDREVIETGERYVVDPHTAVGLCVAERFRKINPPKMVQVVLATAHPAKFSDAVNQSLKYVVDFNFDREVLPEAFKGLLDKPKRVIKVSGIEIELTKTIIAREVNKLFGNQPIDEDHQNTTSV